MENKTERKSDELARKLRAYYIKYDVTTDHHRHTSPSHRVRVRGEEEWNPKGGRVGPVDLSSNLLGSLLKIYWLNSGQAELGTKRRVRQSSNPSE